MVEYMHTAIGVMGVVVNTEGKVLLVLSKDRGWEPPMGFLEQGESPIPALHREILEESGYSVKVTRLTGIYHCVKNGMPILSLCFLCEAGERVRSEVEESLAVQWADSEQLRVLLTHQSHLLRVNDALQDQHMSLRDYTIQPFEVIRSWILGI